MIVFQFLYVKTAITIFSFDLQNAIIEKNTLKKVDRHTGHVKATKNGLSVSVTHRETSIDVRLEFTVSKENHS